MNDLVLGTAEAFLKPFTKKIILHLTQTIQIHPGSKAQAIHRDRYAWGAYLPQSIEPQLNTIWAMTDFTAENGATHCVPGSHRWPWERQARSDQLCQAEMSRGSVFFYTGSILHHGGANHSNAPRLGLNLTYCLGWLRQEEISISPVLLNWQNRSTQGCRSCWAIPKANTRWAITQTL